MFGGPLSSITSLQYYFKTYIKFCIIVFRIGKEPAVKIRGGHKIVGLSCWISIAFRSLMVHKYSVDDYIRQAVHRPLYSLSS